MKTEKKMEKEQKEEGFITLKEMLQNYSTRPKTKYLWSGIKEKTFGFVFGPAKSGKTIFCENMAMNIAIGASEYFGYKLDGVPKKVLFAGLEEYWEERVERNKTQYESLDQEAKSLLETNYMYQKTDFPRKITRKEQWEKLIKLIKDSKAEVVFLDSITRMNHGNIEDSRTAEEIVQRLRDISYDLGITLICIHHTPKMGEQQEITMNCIKGSSSFSQEIDFAIGINKTTKGYRYMKNVDFRYAPEDNETVKEFEIDEDIWLNYTKDSDEMEVLKRSDRRISVGKREKIVSFFNQNPDTTFKTGQLVGKFKDLVGIEERQVKSYLKNLSKSNLITNVSHGKYASVNYQVKKGGEDVSQ